MKLSEIKVKNGKVRSTQNILENDGEWEFVNNDPQIECEFENAAKGVRLTVVVNEQFYSDCVDVYYKKSEQGLSEERKYSFARNFDQTTITDILFDDVYDGVRIDLSNKNTKCSFDSIVIEPIYSPVSLTKELERNFEVNDKEKLLIISHDFSNTGAPILAYNIANKLNDEYCANVVCLNSYFNTNIIKKYHSSNLNYIMIQDPAYGCYSYFGYLPTYKYTSLEDMRIQLYLETARNLGNKAVITNTVVSGVLARALKDYDFLIVSLIHEMKQTIQLYGFDEGGRNISAYSDYIVFPDNSVKNDFVALYPEVYGKCLIRPQGVYLNLDYIPVNQENIASYGIKSGMKYIMGSGTAELRKGIDLFVSAAISLCEQNEDVHFVWTGNFSELVLEEWIRYQIRKAGLENRIHIVPFITDGNVYKTLLANASAFWLTSREDPFPSVALEAMAFHVPVLGFSDSGGYITMAKENRGVAIQHFDIHDLVEKTKEILEEKITINYANVNSFVQNELSFDTYCQYLSDLIHQDQLIQPDLNVYKYQNSVKPHYLSLRDNTFTLQDKMDALKKVNTMLKPKKVSTNEIVLLDTWEGSNNVGDAIIMSYCSGICHNLFPDSKFTNISTHVYDPKIENIGNKLKIICGTNLIYKHMEDSRQLALPKNMENLLNTCLLGVGMQQIGIDQEPSEFTKKLLKVMLNNRYIHSVRDEQTKDFLMSIGINNVINTGCPTMWNLTPEHCNKISDTKSEDVLCTITDYCQDPEADKLMLQILKENYRNVYVWIQGQLDYIYLKRIINCKELKLIPPTLESLDHILDTTDVDYIGTRLHAGIRSLNKYHRTLVIACDNRARAIHKDTDLPIMEREEMGNKLTDWIQHPEKTVIHLPETEIAKWKNQFKRN